MINPDRLIVPSDNFDEGFPSLGFSNKYSMETLGEEILITDPTYLADVYNSRDPISSFLRDNGVFVMDFGGDVSGPVWWSDPYVAIPISLHYSESDLESNTAVDVLAEEVGTDSGSFIFLPLTADLPNELTTTIKKLVSDKNAVLLDLPAGRWYVFYEQFEPKPGSPESFYRNIVLKWEKSKSQANNT
jgi:hypothetical protein